MTCDSCGERVCRCDDMPCPRCNAMVSEAESVVHGETWLCAACASVCDVCDAPHDGTLPVCAGPTCRYRVCNGCAPDGLCAGCRDEAELHRSIEDGERWRLASILLTSAIIGGVPIGAHGGER